MKRIAAALALAAAVGLAALAPSAARAQETRTPPPPAERPPTPDEAFYRAFYQENGLRDFEKAAGLYADLAAAAAKAGDRAMQVKALLGRARCLRTMQKAEEAGKAVAELLRVDPDNAEAKAMVASPRGGAAGPDTLEARARVLAGWLEQSMTASTMRELRMAGDRAIPIVAESLRKRDLAAVEHAALFLSHYSTPASRAALLAALRDPEVVYATAVAEAICHPNLSSENRDFEDSDLPLLEEIAGRPEIDLRRQVLARILHDSKQPPSLASLVLRLARDPDVSVRVEALKAAWPPGILRALEPAIRASLSAKAPEERAAAAGAAGRDADLLRGLQVPVRALLKDESAAVRFYAFASLAGRDGLTQDDLAGLLDDPDGTLVDRAAVALKDSAPWGETAAAAARKAVQKALRAEIPADGIEDVAALVKVDSRPGGFTPEERVDLFGATWARGFPWGAAATMKFRQDLLDLFDSQVNAAGYLPDMDRLVLRGVDTIPSPDGLVQWIGFWTRNTGTGAREAWIRAAASPDARVRKLAYAAILMAQKKQTLGNQWIPDPPVLPGPVTSVFPSLSVDLGSAEEDLQADATSLACLVPDASMVKDIRALHDRASGEARARLLEVLVRAAGKEALDAVRGDLASKDPAVRTEALGRLVISLGIADPAEIQAYLASGGLPAEVAALWTRWDEAPPLDLLRAFLKGLPADRIDDSILAAVQSLPAAERWTLHEKALRSPSPVTRQHAAERAEEWRVVEAIPYLADLLDDPEDGVRTAASAALQELRSYVDLKASAARLREGGDAATFATAQGLLHSEDPLKRKGAVLALAALGDKAAIPVLLKALDDTDRGVRDAALGALERLGGKPSPESKKGE